MREAGGGGRIVYGARNVRKITITQKKPISLGRHDCRHGRPGGLRHRGTILRRGMCMALFRGMPVWVILPLCSVAWAQNTPVISLVANAGGENSVIAPNIP